MEVSNRNFVTASGDSDPQMPAVVSGPGVYTSAQVAGSPRSSSDNREGTGVASQAPVSLSTTSARINGQAANGSPTVHQVSGSQAAQVAGNTVDVRSASKTRAQAEAKYTKLLEDTLRHLEALESSVRAASNTKIDIKTGTKALGTCFREFLSAARIIGMARSPDTTEQRVRCLQQQQQQQHAQTMKLISEVRDEQLQHQQLMLEKMDTLLQNRQAEGLSNDMSWSHDRLNKQDERLTSQDRKLDKIISELDQIARVSADAPQEQQKQQQHRVELERTSQEADQDQQQQPTWSQVASRTRKPRKGGPPPSKKVQPTTAERLALLQRRVPKTAAVTIDRPVDNGSLVAAMRKVSGSINLASLGVNVLTTRKTRAGGILLEVDGIEKASLLADKIRSVIGDTARVRLPEPRTPVLLLGIPEWVGVEEVLEGLVRAEITGVTAGDVRIQKNAGDRGEYVASLSLPLMDAIQLAETKVVVIGWTKCRVKLLEKNQPTCYRCQEKGHLAAECSNDVKPRRCHRCHDEGHLVRDCRQPPRRLQTDSARQQNQQRSTVSQQENTQRREGSPGAQLIEPQ